MKKYNLQINVFKKTDLMELVKEKSDEGLAISFYLGLNSKVNFRVEANSVLSGELKKVKKNKKYSKMDKAKILSMISMIKKEINMLRLPSESRALVFFLKEKNKIAAYRIPVYVPSKIVIDFDFYIRPIIGILNNFPNYAAAVVERDKFRIFNIFMGKVEGSSDIVKSDVPRRINSARTEWRGLNEKRVQRHIDDHLARHFKKCALITQDYFLKNSCDYLIIGSHKEYKSKFMHYLSASLSKKIAGTWRILPNYNINRIKKKSADIVNEHNKKIEEDLIVHLMEGIGGKRWRFIVGIDSVLDHFYLGKIKMLIIGLNFKRSGFVCKDCHYISSRSGKCSSCGGKNIKAYDLGDEIIEDALDRKIEIKLLFQEHKEFDVYGIGALLREY